jgi:Calx-beta domain
LSAPYDEVVTVDFATVDVTTLAGVNYEATSGTLTFKPGEPTTQMITIDVLDPTSAPEKWFSVHLSNASANARIANEGAFGYWYYDYGYYDYGSYGYEGYYYY